MNTSKSDSRLLLSILALLTVTGLLVKFTTVNPSHEADLGELQNNIVQASPAPTLPLKFTGRFIVDGTQSLESKRLLDIQLAALTRYAEGRHGTVEITESRYLRPRSAALHIATPMRIEQAVRIALPADGKPAEIEAQLGLLGLHQITSAKGQ